MSTGQKQRVKLAQAIAHDPDLVLLDEPTNGLDPIQRDQLLELVRRCGHELGLNVVLSSHLLDEVERTCDRVLILANGVATADASMEEIDAPEQTVAVEVVGDRHTAMAALRSAGVECVEDPDRAAGILCAATGDAVFDAIAAALAGAHVGVVRLGRRRRTLEEAFLAASGGAP